MGDLERHTVHRVLGALGRGVVDTQVAHLHQWQGMRIAGGRVIGRGHARGRHQAKYGPARGRIEPRADFRQASLAIVGGVIQPQRSAQQTLGIGVARPRQQRGGGAFLDFLAAHHHRHAVGPVAHHRQVVSNQQQAHAEFRSQVVQQPQYLCLHRHVERGGGLVGHQQRGLAGDGGGDHGALTLAARQQVGVVVDAPLRLGHAHQVQQFYRALARGQGRGAAMQAQGLADLLAQRQHRVQAGHGFLEDHGDAVAAQGAALTLG